MSIHEKRSPFNLNAKSLFQQASSVFNKCLIFMNGNNITSLQPSRIPSLCQCPPQQSGLPHFLGPKGRGRSVLVCGSVAVNFNEPLNNTKLATASSIFHRQWQLS